MKTEKAETECYLSAPIMEKFFKDKRKNDALVWIPVQCSLLFSEEFQNIAPVNRCIFVSFLLLCGMRGSFEIPFRINYLSNILGIDKRAIKRGIDELIGANLLHKRERKKEEKEKKAQHRQTDTHGERADAENGVVVCVDFKSFSEPKSANENEENFNKSESENNLHRSRFTLEECLRYAKQSDGVRNPNALANSLYQTGNADAFIMAMLYPVEAEAEDARKYGQPIGFTNQPCSICFGAKMADTDGKGYRKCEHCRNERGKSTGFEPVGNEK